MNAKRPTVRLQRTPKPAAGPLLTHALDRGRTHLARPSHRLLCHRCEQPLRVVLPPTGWVTALAGLLARGSGPDRLAFPVSQWLTRTTGSPLTVAGAATDWGCVRQPAPCSLLPPRYDPGNQHGGSFTGGILRVKAAVVRSRPCVAARPHRRRDSRWRRPNDTQDRQETTRESDSAPLLPRCPCARAGALPRPRRRQGQRRQCLAHAVQGQVARMERKRNAGPTSLLSGRSRISLPLHPGYGCCRAAASVSAVSQSR